MRTVQATGSSITAFDLIVPTFFALALLINAVLPYLGLVQVSATCTLVLATLGLIGLIRACPELADTPVVIGGKLGIAGPAGLSSRNQLRAVGFDAVFDGDSGMAAFRRFTERLMVSVGT